MVDLVLRPSGRPESENKPWSLQLRWHESLGETEYLTLARVSDDMAQQIMRAGAPFWLFGEPDWNERETARRLERARQMEEQAAQLRGDSAP